MQLTYPDLSSLLYRSRISLNFKRLNDVNFWVEQSV